MEDDTIKLLRECNAGIKMGVTSLNDVLDHVNDTHMRDILQESKNVHEKLGDETHKFLNEYHDQGKEPAVTGQDDVLDEDKCEAGRRRIRSYGGRSDHRWLQYGRKIPVPLSASVSGSFRIRAEADRESHCRRRTHDQRNAGVFVGGATAPLFFGD